MSSRPWSVVACLVPLAAAGCGDEASAPVTFEQYCARYAELTCEFAERCDCLAGGTVELCRLYMDGECADEVEEPVNAGRRSYDAAAAAGCLAGLQALLGDCALDDVDWPADCDRMLVGLLAAGASCESDADCVPGLECHSGACTDLPGNGEACLAGAYCADNLYCGNDELCHAPQGVGGPCPEGNEACGDDLYCDLRTSTCASYLAQGESCRHANAVCIDGLYCAVVAGTCEPLPGVGGDCADSSGACAEGLYCDGAGHVCRELLADGAACTDDGQCRSDDCTGGVCVADPGGSCPGF
ncbi:MAG: hypothetical protein JXB32_11945 [Deltaproteobacteria bacterium]|nr:hypothetical protein [Deltaproteobacteria bacterium]